MSDIKAIETRHVLHARKNINDDSIRFHSQQGECVRLEVFDDWLTVYMDESTASGVLKELERALDDVTSQRFNRERDDD
tara:strand:- start:3376 stop:3612 length:237 start_codon:yes stop_codon:yes gene_type:complete